MHSLEKRVLLPEDLKPINTFEAYKAAGGMKGLEKAREMARDVLIRHVKSSGLRGRGGAGFPTGIKWDTVASDPAPVKYVVCNMAEGEPGTYKDRYLVSKNPYVVLEGMLIAAYAVNAHQAIIGTKEKFKFQVGRLQAAIKEMQEAEVFQEDYVRLVLGPDDYLFGEEKGLLEVIDGRDPMPRLFPPYMIGVGYTPTDTNPTVVNNAETMAHLPHILADGYEAFRSNGTDDTPGTMILSLSGDVKKPGMYEVPLGITLNQLLNDLGGGPVGEHPFKAVFSGVANPVATPDQFGTQLDFGSMRESGIGLGSGGFIVYDQSRWMVDVTVMFSRFLAFSSCGQCIPCNRGTRVITEHLERIQANEGTQEDIDAIIAECGRCTNQTRCFLPVQESKLVPSVYEKFPTEFEPNAVNEFDYNRSILVPKLESYDELAGQFVYEKNPKEFV